MSASSLHPAPHRASHPAVYFVLFAPFSALSGYLAIAAAYALAQAKVPAEAIAGLLAVTFMPHAVKFLWAPIVDLTLTRKTWYLIGCVGSAAGIFITGMTPYRLESIPFLTAVAVAAGIAASLLGMSVESLMAHATPAEEKGRAAGWMQAGNMAGASLGGGLALWMMEDLHVSAMLTNCLMAVLTLACAAALPLVREPAPESGNEGFSLKASARAAGKDLWEVASSRLGLLAILVCFLPIGSGGAGNLWSVVAADWHARPATVALVTGVLSGIVSAGGSLLGGFICDRMDRKWAYCLFGGLQALCALAMAAAPHSESSFVIFTTLYALTTGLCYTGYAAVVLEAIGKGAAATKYSLLASLANMPLSWMTLVAGYSQTHWGNNGMLQSEAAIGAAALAVFALAAKVAQRRAGPAAEAAGTA